MTHTDTQKRTRCTTHGMTDCERCADANELTRLRSELAQVTAERDAFKRGAKLMEHKVITCGVAASHPDASLSESGAYIEKWNSQQAEEVRTLRRRADAAQARCVEVEALLSEFMTITTGGIVGGMTEMSSLEGRQEFYERVNAVRKKVLDASLNGTKEQR